MRLQLILASLWNFRHDEGFAGQLVQVGGGILMWSLFTYVPLKLILMAYEIGKGENERREIEGERDDFPSAMGWYRNVFCLRIAMTVAFGTEGARFGDGWPSVLLFAFGVAAWYALSPERRWMRYSR